MKRTGILCAALLTAVATPVTVAHAQYPTVPEDIKAQASAKKAAADKHSDEAWAKAQPAIKAGAAKGKPYIPRAFKPSDLPQADIPAFPGAEGGGMYTFGGRGGKVYVVTNLNDDGPGSFREACEAGGARIVVFNVAGVIRLKDHLRIRAPYITIAGNTAPGDGVCIAGNTVELETHDVLIRYMRFRRGETQVGDRDDSLGGNPIGNIMLDHLSTSWGLDENLSMYRHMYHQPDGGPDLKLATVNLSLQNCISSEALDTYHHAFGSTIGGYNSTFYHCLWACNTGRNPSVGMIYDFTFANNVIFNWRHRTIDGGDQRTFYTILNNYFKPGPITPVNELIGHRILKPEVRRGKPTLNQFGKAYVAGNIVEGDAAVTQDNWAGGVQIGDAEDKGSSESHAVILKQVRSDKPYPHAYLEIQSAKDAYEYVLANAGATLPHRDPVDTRVVEMVRTGKVSYADGKGILTDIKQVGGYPEYKGTPYKDSDGDGIPDAWEIAYGLNPNDPSDASKPAANGSGYANIEEFLNGRDPRKKYASLPTPRTYIDLWGGHLAEDNSWQTGDVVHVP